MKVIAFVNERESIGKILDHLGLPSTGRPVAKARLQALALADNRLGEIAERDDEALGPGPGRTFAPRARTWRAPSLAASGSTVCEFVLARTKFGPTRVQNPQCRAAARLAAGISFEFRRDDWSGRQDLNLRPPVYELGLQGSGTG